MVSIDILGAGFKESAPIAIRAASSCAAPFLYPLPFPSSLPLTVKHEYGDNGLSRRSTNSGRSRTKRNCEQDLG